MFFFMCGCVESNFCNNYLKLPVKGHLTLKSLDLTSSASLRGLYLNKKKFKSHTVYSKFHQNLFTALGKQVSTNIHTCIHSHM